MPIWTYPPPMHGKYNYANKTYAAFYAQLFEHCLFNCQAFMTDDWFHSPEPFRGSQNVSLCSRCVTYSMQRRRISEYLIMAFQISPYGNGSPVTL